MNATFEEDRLAVIVRGIDRIVNDEVSIIEAICYYAEQHEIEVEALAELLKKSAPVVSRIRDAATRLNLMEKSPSLF